MKDHLDCRLRECSSMKFSDKLEIIARIRRTSMLGKLGEQLAAEALSANGFQNVSNLNDLRNNYPFFDLRAERDGKIYFIEVKTRNEKRDSGGLNSSYNCITVSDRANKILKSEGYSASQITKMAIDRIDRYAADHGAVPAWVAIPVRPGESTYAAYFGLLEDLGLRRSILMTPIARENYVCLASWNRDSRIKPELTNQA